MNQAKESCLCMEVDPGETWGDDMPAEMVAARVLSTEAQQAHPKSHFLLHSAFSQVDAITSS